MKEKIIFSLMLLCFLATFANAQNAIPTGYAKGTINLANGNILEGFVNFNFEKKSTVTYMDDAGKNKKVYEGAEVNGLVTDSLHFISINGDFFKIICTGKLNFLQKSSNSFGDIFYNGNVAILNEGTEGKIGDHFIYRNNELKLLNKKNIESFINTELTGCNDAIQKAKLINGDIAKLEGAVNSYNNNTN